MYYIPDNLRTYHPVQVSYVLNGELGVVYGRSTEGIEPTNLIVSAYGLALQLDAQEDGFIELAFPKTIIDGAGVYGISIEDYTTYYPHPYSNVTVNGTHNIVKQFIPKHARGADLKGTFMAANPTFAESVECEQLGIEISMCTAKAIATKRASMENPPEPPVVAGQLLTLVAASQSNKYEAYVEWYHNDIGTQNSFSVRIVDPDEPTVALSVDSDLRIYDGDEYLLPTLMATDDDNINDYNFAFPEPGSYTLIISVVEFNDSRERIEIPIQVTPEFPQLSLLLSAASAVSVFLALSRPLSANRQGLGKVFQMFKVLVYCLNLNYNVLLIVNTFSPNDCIAAASKVIIGRLHQLIGAQIRRMKNAIFSHNVRTKF
jgi:hypothetical protein